MHIQNGARDLLDKLCYRQNNCCVVCCLGGLMGALYSRLLSFPFRDVEKYHGKIRITRRTRKSRKQTKNLCLRVFLFIRFCVVLFSDCNILSCIIVSQVRF